MRHAGPVGPSAGVWLRAEDSETSSALLAKFSGGSRIFRGGDFGNPTRSEGVWACGRMLCICELGRGNN